MIKVFISMGLMTLLFLFGGGFISMFFTNMVGGGVEQSFIYPIYCGIIVLTGVVVGATQIIIEEIRELKELIKKP